jgi:endonuclease/exonuclease/phosphatase family metal-dependent hydrolase
MRWPISCTPLALAPLKRYRITHNPRLIWRSYYEATMRALILLALLLMAVPAWAQEIKLATWNIAWLTTKPAGHPDLPQNLTIRTEQDFARLRAYAERLAADVIALQEVDGPLAAARVFDATAYDFHFPAESDVQRTGFAWRKGLQVTRNPDLMALDLRPTARRSLRRGADITLHGANGARLRLLSIHLDGGCSQGSIRQPNSSDCQSLGQQAQILAEWITERRRENMPFVILGDFNRRFSRDDDMLSMLNAASPMRRATEGLSNPCWSRDGQGRAFIDHILLGLRAADWLVKDSFRVFSYGERDPALRDVISDHCPISVRLQLP